MLLLLLACNEQALQPDPNKPGADSQPAPVESLPETEDSPPPLEECNGVDDDGDGLVDEGFADDNQNGQVDCLDQECPEVLVGAEHSVEPVAACTPVLGGPADPWAVRVQWAWGGLAQDASFDRSFSAPVVGNLDDDNGDGVIDDLDGLDIVMIVTRNYDTVDAETWLVMLDGATGEERWHSEMTMVMGATLAVADVDADGMTDIVAMNDGFEVVVLDGDGRKKWKTDQEVYWKYYPMLTVADVDADGMPEVLADDLVINGEDGTLQAQLPSDHIQYSLLSFNPLPLDLDGDGQQEILRGGNAYRLDGTLLWWVPPGNNALHYLWAASVQADADPLPEVLELGQAIHVADGDGTLIFSTALDAHSPGPPCVGDFDGDGVSEVAWPDYATLNLYELDGTLLWSAPTKDASSAAGCSGFDLDGDGGLEVLYADEEAFFIFDGQTGAVRFSEPTHHSQTLFEYPVVADVDRDGAAEIVVVGDVEEGGAILTVYEHDGSGWPGAGPTWATHDFSMTNVEADGHVPARPAPAWSQYGVFRARVGEDSWFQQPDLVASITGACVMDCTFGPVEVALQVGNQGYVDVWEGTLLTLYADQGDHLERVTTVSLPTLPAGTWLGGWTLSLDPAQVGSHGFVVIIDDDGTGVGGVGECDEANNTAVFREAVCP